MGPVFRAQLINLVRNPWAVVIVTVLTVLMSFMFGYQATSSIVVGVVASPSLDEAATTAWLERLTESETFTFALTDEEQLRAQLSSSSGGLGLRLEPTTWTVLAANGDANAQLLASYVASVYRHELTLRDAAARLERVDLGSLRAELAAELANPALRVSASAVEAETSFAYDARVHTLLGMGLFFASFTIMFGVTNILEERRLGVWYRVIFSPVTRLAMYAGHLTYSFLLGFAQVTAVFLVFRFVFDVPLGENLGGALLVIAAYTFAVVALGLLLAGLVGNVQRMNVVVPIVAVSSAMLGGAYWPLEIVSSEIMRTLANFAPIRHAMDALKGIAYHSYGMADLLWPIAVLVLFGVVFMGVGLRLVERPG